MRTPGPYVVFGDIPLPAAEVAAALSRYAHERVQASIEAKRRQRGGIIQPFYQHPWMEAADWLHNLKLPANGQLGVETLATPPRQPLTEWARAHGIEESTARRWARNKVLQTTDQVSRVWTIETTEQPPERGRHHVKRTNPDSSS